MRGADVRQAHAGLLDIARRLEPGPVSETDAALSGTDVRRQVEMYLDSLDADVAAGRVPGWLCEPVRHIGIVLRRLGHGLDHCYDVPALPRTANALEQFYRRVKTEQRRLTGRKRSDAFVVRVGGFDATKVPLVGGEWSEIKLGVFSDLVPGQDEEGRPVPRATRHSYAARWESAERFARTVTLEANRRGLDEAGLVVSPNDGADWIQGLLDRIAPQAVRILDEMHAAEHLGASAGLVFGAGTAAKAWVERQRTRLKTAPPEGVLAELAHCQMRGPRPGMPPGEDGVAPEQALAREVASFHKRVAQIRDAAFRQQEYPIGSGTVESGHRVVLGARFRGAGQHGEPRHLNPLLVLRTALGSERWDATWPVIEAHRRVTARAARAHRRRRQRLTRFVTCLRQLPAALPLAADHTLPPPPPGLTPPAPAPLLSPAPRPRKTSPWYRSNALFFLKDQSA